jgi:hypothetical protein
MAIATARIGKEDGVLVARWRRWKLNARDV